MTRSRRVPCRLVILGRIAIAFGNNDEGVATAMRGDWPDEESILYHGDTPIPHKVCEPIALLHPNFIKYYADAMMTLYRGEGLFSRGTESPSLAVNSFNRLRDTNDPGYVRFKRVIVWDPFK